MSGLAVSSVPVNTYRTGIEIGTEYLGKLRDWTVTDNTGKFADCRLIGKIMFSHVTLAVLPIPTSLVLAVYDLALGIFALLKCEWGRAFEHALSFVATPLVALGINALAEISLPVALPLYVFETIALLLSNTINRTSSLYAVPENQAREALGTQITVVAGLTLLSLIIGGVRNTPY